MDEPALVLWIPQVIYADKKLSSAAKLILAEIFNLLKANSQCWASNGHFAEVFGLERANVSYHIQLLIKQGWIFSESVKECQQEKCHLKEKGWHRHIIAGEPLSKILDSLSSRTGYPIKSNRIPYQVASHHKSNIESNNEIKGNLEKIEKIKKEIRRKIKHF